jgi:hypothetical protein
MERAAEVPPQLLESRRNELAVDIRVSRRIPR